MCTYSYVGVRLSWFSFVKFVKCRFCGVEKMHWFGNAFGDSLFRLDVVSNCFLVVVVRSSIVCTFILFTLVVCLCVLGNWKGTRLIFCWVTIDSDIVVMSVFVMTF
uniref:(northern house mosquito) hypothetical protein n=1 Tax=Culex pipiens TaxID=7175 RepID=A0A8D8MS40_CULPI